MTKIHKIFFVLFLVIFAAAGCNSNTTKKTNVTTEQKTATSTLDPEIVYDQAGKELADPPLSKQMLPQSFSSKMVEFTVRDDNGGDVPFIVKVTLDTSTLDYKAETDAKDGFSYVSANGIICFTKKEFKNSYCLREKYTPAALAKQYAGEKVQVRELEEDEKTIDGLLMEMGWSPGNILAAMMARAEKGIQMLNNHTLKDGAVMEFKDDRDKLYATDTISNVVFSDKLESFKTQGLHLAAILTTLYNREEKAFPYADFERRKTDEGFVEAMKEDDIDLNKYILKQ